ncbi:2-C-methyl-D-erythritol 4-phosphate cytidylyltransferase [Porphyromonas levii]|uniref:2-C-methyl-D-erythritol 4-phosphate cytidylyltransferase n=1 Tax=Porphyromonas levii TaxID=28114 RepID=A0A4Y8WRM0_9PORP|nr:2-C-methyl-D-erythritol 4-phosphate cytidylyltransferase [Porphyromonas levii]MBR8802137.1 2-C-methyl-D-erythritol 4-phosphate cytidylyltransferase [Porphyromonas levii]TFH96664.1 2-C-methyl-D-erythritol 4-phosphate cytidylyltransferase [Porphyromonas levii]TFH96993.1 2-C-methyl-D-erythritol 4-phosphate cytidylyltransferase [Porphyromonas levii]
MKELSIIIVAGGKGLRMESNLPKQYLMLHVKPTLVWTIEHLFEAVDKSIDTEFILVRPKSDDDYVQDMMSRFLKKGIELKYADGGRERAESVRNGLDVASGSFVMVHDGVRPFVTNALLNRIWDAKMSGAVVPALPPTDSTRILTEEGLYRSIPRNGVRLIQTPQLFERELLRDSYKAYFSKPDSSCTDDASIVELYGGLAPSIVEGEEQNFKITTPKDLALATWCLSKRELNE